MIGDTAQRVIRKKNCQAPALMQKHQVLIQTLRQILCLQLISYQVC